PSDNFSIPGFINNCNRTVIINLDIHMLTKESFFDGYTERTECIVEFLVQAECLITLCSFSKTRTVAVFSLSIKCTLGDTQNFTSHIIDRQVDLAVIIFKIP